MLCGKKIVVVLPAYNAEKTLMRTYEEIPKDIVDEILLTDDCSSDRTTSLSRNLQIPTFQHRVNHGYGGNQKTCYWEALKRNADIVVMLHPDYQYPPKLIPAMAGLIVYDMFDVVLGSRILGGEALAGGMPLYKYVSNRVLTMIQNILMNQKLSEYHTGYRAFSRKVLESIPFELNSDDFIFDNQFLTQATHFGFRIGEITCPTQYFKDASSINLTRSMRYGLGVLLTCIQFVLQKYSVSKFRIFNPPKQLSQEYRTANDVVTKGSFLKENFRRYYKFLFGKSPR